jgi:hypothetical protein
VCCGKQNLSCFVEKLKLLSFQIPVPSEIIEKSFNEIAV